MTDQARLIVSGDVRRQLIVERQLLDRNGRNARTISGVMSALGLLHATDPSTPWLSIQARSGASIAQIEAAFYGESCQLLRHSTIRGTAFVMAADILPLAHGAFNPRLVERLRAQLGGWLEGSGDLHEPADQFLNRTEKLVLSRLSDAGPATGAQLANDVVELHIRIVPSAGAGRSTSMRITSRVLEIMAADGQIARGRPTGSDFTSGSWTWMTLADRWPQGIEPVPPNDALAGLLDRYLVAFGPATVTDMAWWTGLTKTAVRSALAVIGAVEVGLADSEPGFVRLSDVDRVASSVASDAAVNLLPGLDATTMGWKQRSWYVDDSPESGLFDQNGNAGPTVWVDGRVVGAWTQRSDGEIVVDVISDVGRSAFVQIEAQAERLAEWLGEVRVKWRFPTTGTKQLGS